MCTIEFSGEFSSMCVISFGVCYTLRKSALQLVYNSNWPRIVCVCDRERLMLKVDLI